MFYIAGLVLCILLKKLDGVSFVDNRPSTDYFRHFVKKKWHITRDTWHMTCDTWHVTHGGGGVNILSKFQLPSSYRLGFMMLWRLGGNRSLNQLMNDEAVYRTAPATPSCVKNSLDTSIFFPCQQPQWCKRLNY